VAPRNGCDAAGSGAKAKFALYRETLRTSRTGRPGGIFHRQGEFATIPSSPLASRSQQNTEAPQYAFLRHSGIYLVRWGFKNQNQTLSQDRTASRQFGPSPGKGTRREDRAPSHRPQMSSGRLFLDRVARQQSPSLLHRHPEINTHSREAQAEGDISTLPGRATFLLCRDTACFRVEQ